MHERTRFLLNRTIGVAPSELVALGVAPIHRLPDAPRGFGLTGSTGRGKTFALVQHLAGIVDRIVAAAPDPEQATLPVYAYAVWVNWPDQAETLKRMVARSSSHELDLWIERVHEAQILVLDDLGQERIKGEEDYATGLLREILDRRYRQGQALYWTSNLNAEGLTKLYGARTISRLLDAWPPTPVQGQDLRIQRLAARTA